MTWKYKLETSEDQSIVLKMLDESDQIISFDEFIHLSQNDLDFATELTAGLKELPQTSFDMELPPISIETMSRKFEITLIPLSSKINSNDYSGQSVQSSWEEDETNSSYVFLSFKENEAEKMVDLIDWMRDNSTDEAFEFWQEMGAEIENELSMEHLFIFRRMEENKMGITFSSGDCPLRLEKYRRLI